MSINSITLQGFGNETVAADNFTIDGFGIGPELVAPKGTVGCSRMRPNVGQSEQRPNVGLSKDRQYDC